MPEPYSISLLNDSFPPLIDGVANTVVNYARELTKAGGSGHRGDAGASGRR